MTDIQREELISAYLDGELSPEERARVEGWLAESAELRLLHDDLLALRVGMQTLPRHKLERDLSDSVIRRAAPVVARPAGGDSGSTKVVPGSTSLWERGSHVRRLLWPALAVGAALAILIYDANTRPDEQQVALGPREAGTELESQPFDVDADAPDEVNIGAAPASPAAAFAREETPQEGKPLVTADRAPPEAGRGEQASPVAGEGSFAKRAPQMPAKQGSAESPLRGGSANMQEAAPEADQRRMRALPGSSQSSAGAKVDAQPTIVYAVSEAYLQDKEFEKLLNANGIVWQRLPTPVDEQVAMDQVAKAESDAAIPPVPRQQELQQQTLYFLQATSSQVDGVLSKVPQAPEFKQGKQTTVLPRFTAPQRKLGDESEPGVQVLLVAPQQALPTATPAQPAAKSPPNR